MNLLRVYTSLILSLLIEDFASRPGMSCNSSFNIEYKY